MGVQTGTIYIWDDCNMIYEQYFTNVNPYTAAIYQGLFVSSHYYPAFFANTNYIPAGQKVFDARFKAYTSAAASTNVYTNTNGSGTSETGITYANQGNGGTYYSNYNTVASGWTNWDFTSLVQTWVNNSTPKWFHCLSVYDTQVSYLSG